MEIISLKNKSKVPKYKQIVSSIENAIATGLIKKGSKTPSLNSIKDKHKVSRDTVLTAFNELKNRGIIQSIVGKGYYVSSENINVHQKVFLLFDELNSFKEDLYNSFLENLNHNRPCFLAGKVFEVDGFQNIYAGQNVFHVLTENFNNKSRGHHESK